MTRGSGTGLHEPLLHNGGDEETGASSQSQNRNGGGTANEESAATETSLLSQDYRFATAVAVVLDLFLSVILSWFMVGFKAMFLDHQYTFSHSVADIIWVGLMKAILIALQTSRYESLRATKIAGYTSLLCLLFFIIKLCSMTDGWSDNWLFTVLLISNLLFCMVECIYELLVSVYSSKDLSATVAPTANEAAEGIAVDEVKNIGTWELFKVLKPYFWPDGLLNRICVLMTWIFLLLSKASNVLAPLYIAKATDDLTSEKGNKMALATKHVVVYACLLFANKTLKEAQALSYIRVKLIASVQLKEKVFTHLLSLSMDWHQRKSMGAVVTAMERGVGASNMVVQYIFLYLFPTLIEAVVVSSVFITAFGAPLLAAVAICGCTIYMVTTIELTIFRMQFRKRMNKADNDASNKLTDSLLNIDTVKYFTSEEHELKRYKESVETLKDQAGKIQGSLSLLNTSQQFILNSTLVAALLVAAHEYVHHDLSVGQFIAVNVYIMQLFAPLNFLGSIYSMAIGSYIDLQNLCNILAETPDIQDRPESQTLTVAPDTPLDIEFRDVVFAYPSRMEVQVLKGINFCVAAGSTTAIVGETGSGKSTLTRLLFRFYEANQGQVLIGGKNVLDLTQISLRSNIGVVPQDHSLFNDTLEYNIRYGSHNSMGDDVEKAVHAAGLDDFVSSLPKGLKTVVGERGQQVSGGQKQRIAIARVLMKDSPVVVLDEATSSLDSRTEAQIQDALECLKGRTMLVIAHRLSTIQHADQIIVMANGDILERGSHDALLAKGNWHDRCYASLWDKQKKAE